MKALKTTVAILLSVILCLTMLTACQPNGTAFQIDNVTTTTEAATTTTTTTTTTTATTPPPTVNLDLLSEIGMPFSQIQEKHGDVVAIWYLNGGPIVKLQDGSGKYGFEEGFAALDGDMDSSTRDANDQYHMDPLPQPKPDAVIRTLHGMTASSVFVGLSERVNGEQLADMYGVTFKYARPADRTMDGYNLCDFEFEGVTISVITEDDFCVTPDSIVYFIRKTA